MPHKDISTTKSQLKFYEIRRGKISYPNISCEDFIFETMNFILGVLLEACKCKMYFLEKDSVKRRKNNRKKEKHATEYFARFRKQKISILGAGILCSSELLFFVLFIIIYFFLNKVFFYSLSTGYLFSLPRMIFLKSPNRFKNYFFMFHWKYCHQIYDFSGT